MLLVRVRACVSLAILPRFLVVCMYMYIFELHGAFSTAATERDPFRRQQKRRVPRVIQIFPRHFISKRC